ncbi:MAG: B12-binding domain-containing radical SAM protein [Verrucomicrobiae bacterium]|nr:B12-binding domain-containing radical SAM protein [Verrucomicrobiae bacterium]
MNRFVMVPIYLFCHEGARSITSYLRSKGHQTQTVYFCDGFGLKPSEETFSILFDTLRRLQPTIVGISFFCTHRATAERVARFCKSELGALVVAGGVHATIDPEDTLRFSDIVIQGDGEIPLHELLTQYQGDAAIAATLPGAVYRDAAGALRYGKPNTYIDLDDLPFPDLDEDAIFIQDGKTWTGLDPATVAEINVFGSRGCPYVCTYCSNSFLNDLPNRPRVRVKSAEYILAELERDKKRFRNATKVVFGDEMLLANRRNVEAMLEEYPRRIGLPFGCFFHPNNLTEDLMEKLIGAGMIMARAGIQAMSQKTRAEIYARNTRDADIIRVARLFQKHPKARLAFDLIVNNPLESEEDIQRGFEFMLTVPGNFELLVHVLLHLPKTKLTERFLKAGLITTQQIEGYNLHPNTWAINILSRDLQTDAAYGIDRFWLYLTSLISKHFIPRGVLRAMSRSRFLRRHPSVLFYIAYGANIINTFLLFLRLLRNREFRLAQLLKHFSSARTALFRMSR